MEAGVREVGDVAMLLFPTIHRTEAPSSFALVQLCDHMPTGVMDSVIGQQQVFSSSSLVGTSERPQSSQVQTTIYSI